MEEGREIWKTIENEIGTIKILKPNRKTTQQEIDHLYQTLARIYIKIEMNNQEVEK